MVKNLFSLLSVRQSNILSAALVLMISVLGSKALGLIRYRLLVHNFNTSEAALFLGAFSLPDLLFQLLIFGALSVAFIPVFTDLLQHKGEEQAFRFASNILNLSLALFAIFAVIAFIFTPFLNSFLLPGYTGAEKVQTDQLTRIILLGQLLLIIGAFFIAITQSFQRFLISSLAPLFYNLGIILGIWLLTPYFGLMGPALGVVLGAALHVAIQVPIVSKLGFRWQFSFDFFDEGVREILRLMSIRNIGLIFEQISDRVAIALASLVSVSSVTLLTFAQQLFIVPISLFGATIAQAALPILSKEQSKGEPEAFKGTLLTSMHQILFLTLPAAAILIVLRIPVVRLIYGAPQFNWDDTVLTGRTVAFFALGLASQSVLLLLVRAFYALKDTNTPVIVSILSVLLNISISFFMINKLQLDVWSLGLAYAVATNFSAFLLLFFLDKKLGGFSGSLLFKPALKMLLAAVIAAIALYIPVKALDQQVVNTTKTVGLLLLTGIASFFGLMIYILLVWLMRIKELYTFIDLIQKTLKMQFIKVKPQELVEEPGGV